MRPVQLLDPLEAVDDFNLGLYYFLRRLGLEEADIDNWALDLEEAST